MKNLDYTKITALTFMFTSKDGENIVEMPLLKFGHFVRETEKAIQLYMDRYDGHNYINSGSCWVPKSQIVDIIGGEKGSLASAIIPKWLCDKIEINS